MGSPCSLTSPNAWRDLEVIIIISGPLTLIDSLELIAYVGQTDFLQLAKRD